jgi:hypothetical protein
MFEPRRYGGWLKSRPNMRFLGGIADFDLWYRDDLEANKRGVNIPEPDVLRYLRLVRISDAVGDWDDFRLPLHLNIEINASMEPAKRLLKGRWGDIYLTRDQVNEVETYLRCFAPWVLGPQTNEEGT